MCFEKNVFCLNIHVRFPDPLDSIASGRDSSQTNVTFVKSK